VTPGGHRSPRRPPASAGRAARPPALPAAFWYLFGGMLVNRLGAFVLLYLALYLTRERGFGVGTAGMAVAAYGIGSILSSVCGGILTDVWGRLRTMLLSLVLGAVLTALLAVTSAPGQLLAVSAALGLATDLYKPASKAAVADLVGEEGRVRAFGLLYWAANIGFSASAAIGGLIASRSFTALFLIDAATSLLCALIIGYGMRSVRWPAWPAGPRRARAGLKTVLADRIFMVFAALCLVFWWVYFQIFVALPVTLMHDGLGSARYGMIIAVNGVTVVLLQPPINRLVRRVQLAHAMVGAAVFLGVGFGMFAWARGLPLFMTAVIIWTVGEIIFNIAAPALVAGLAPPSLQGRYQGMFGLGVSIALFTGPAMGSLLLARFGVASFWSLCLAICLAVAIAHYSLAGSYGRTVRARKDLSLATTH
jgi:MFS family permease